MKEGQMESAARVISLGRSLSPSNVLLLFIESYYNYLCHDLPVSQQVECLTLVLYSLLKHAVLSLLCLSLPLSFCSSCTFFILVSNRNSNTSDSSKSLILQSTGLLLRTQNYNLHLLSAKALLRLRRYQKVMEICKGIEANVKEDDRVLSTARHLYHLASKLLAKESQPSQLCQSSSPLNQPSLFQTTGSIQRLLSGGVCQEELLPEGDVESTLFQSLCKDPSLTLLQKAVRVPLLILSSLKMLVLNPTNLYYRYIYFVVHADCHLRHQPCPVTLSTLLQFGSSLLEALHNAVDVRFVSSIHF